MTTDLDTVLASMRKDFAAATFPDGGLLLHLPSGDFFPLGPVESAIWEVVARMDTTDATLAATATALNTSMAEARSLLERIADQTRTVRGHPAPTDFRFFDDGQVLSLRASDQTMLSLNKQSLVLTVAEKNHGRSDEELAELLRVFVPKLFGRWYPLALHASAVGVGDRTVLFCGESGAGKTTTARVIMDTVPGSRLFSEDVVLLADVDGALMMVDQAEKIIQSWMTDATAALVERRERSYAAGPLRRDLEAASGRLPLHRAVFLHADRRRGPEWSLAALPPSATLARVFLHSFFHSSDVVGLRDHLHVCRALAIQIKAADAIEIPAGLDALRASSRAQIDTIAS